MLPVSQWGWTCRIRMHSKSQSGQKDVCSLFNSGNTLVNTLRTEWGLLLLILLLSSEKWSVQSLLHMLEVSRICQNILPRQSRSWELKRLCSGQWRQKERHPSTVLSSTLLSLVEPMQRARVRFQGIWRTSVQLHLELTVSASYQLQSLESLWRTR